MITYILIFETVVVYIYISYTMNGNKELLRYCPLSAKNYLEPSLQPNFVMGHGPK